MQKRKIGTLIVGVNGATANTTIAGTILQKKGLIPEESFKRGMLTEDDCFKEHNLIDHTQIVFGGWDINNKDAYEAAIDNRVLDKAVINSVKEELRKIRPMKAVHTPHDVDETRVSDHSKNGASLQRRVDSLREDIASFKRVNRLDEAVVICLGSPLKAQGTGAYESLEKFKMAIMNNDEGLTSGMLYAYAALEENCPFVDFTPNITLETEALLELADVGNVPLAGRDSILAAPLILDLIKLVEYAQRIGGKGIQSHLALFFKNPLGTKARGFFDQYRLFVDYYESLAKNTNRNLSRITDRVQISSPYTTV